MHACWTRFHETEVMEEGEIVDLVNDIWDSEG